MTLDSSQMRDNVTTAAGYQRPTVDQSLINGSLRIVLTGADGDVKYDHTLRNVVTRVGEQMYGERGAGISGALAAPTGMQLGTGTTATAKVDPGASIVTLVPNSLVAISTPSSSIPGTVRRITYVATWVAGSATATGIAEVALVNQATGTQTAAPASATIARALLSPTVNKGAADSLTITWNHDLGT